MPFISELNIGPSGDTTSYDIKDKNAQKKNLSSPVVVRGQNKTTVESTLRALAEGYSTYVEDGTLYLPTNASVDGKVLIIT